MSAPRYRDHATKDQVEDCARGLALELLPRRVPVSELDCRSCGACCVVYDAVEVLAGDPTPRYLTRSVRGLLGFALWEGEIGTRAMRTFSGRCAALRGEPGEACRCACYARRPAVCRSFAPGSRECLEARETLATMGPS